MALPATDDFNRADGGLGANWTTQLNALAIVSNQAQGSVSDNCCAFWNADSFSADQYSQFTCRGSGYRGPGVRCTDTGAGSDGYFTSQAPGDAGGIYKLVNGSFTRIGDTGGVAADGDVLRLEVDGTDLSVYKNAFLIGSLSDASLSSGSAGVLVYQSAGQLDDWEGGNLGAPVVRRWILGPH
jgi:hypothetical protein